MDKASPYLIVIAGGSGTRFWPKSTSRKPKQLLSFGATHDGHGLAESLLQQTLHRFDSFVSEGDEHRFIITTRALEKAIGDQADGARVLVEPQGRNTAACVYWGARVVAKKDPKAVMLVMPADHYIAFPDRFLKTVESACEWARTHDDLVTLGITPTRPETGYGYLKIGQSLGGACSKVEAFVEKPDLAKAEAFLRAGNYLWNGGMFVWRAEVILKAFDEFMPEMKAAWEKAAGDPELAYPNMTATSIDFGVMEKARNVVSFSLDCGWDDLGSWISLEGVADVLGARKGQNVVTAGDLLSVESVGNIVDVPGRLVALLGVRDLIVVEHNGALLVADKKRAQDIRLVVDQLKKQRPELV